MGPERKERMERIRGLLAEELASRVKAGAGLAEMEEAAQQVSREAWGSVIGQAASRTAAAVPTRGQRCPRCQGGMRLVDRHRPRAILGLCGSSRLERAYLVCGRCGHGYAPADEGLGLGSGAWSPGLQRAASRLGVEVSFAQAAQALSEVLGVPIPDDDVRRATEGIGAVAEREEQDRVAAARQGQEVVGEPASDTLVVAVDGGQVHTEGAWHEGKVGVAAPLGPEQERDPDTGRRRLAVGRQSFCVGLEDAEAFFYRLYALATGLGLGHRRLRRVVVLGDGAEWIWTRAATFLGVGQVQVIEIVDLWHARQHLWQVAHAVFGEGSAAAARWAQPLCEALLAQGPEPIQQALRALPPPTETETAHTVRCALDYFTHHAHRMRYPEFAAAGLPLGSGLVESAVKLVVAARQKGSGMRWSQSGAQSVGTLRAL